MILAAERSALKRGARALGIELTEQRLEQLLEYLELLYGWRKVAGLTAIPRADAVRLHLLDSLSILGEVSVAERIADLGTGGGLPGLPIAICVSSAQITLIESRRRRCTFLLETIRHLGLDNCTVLELDAQHLYASGRRFDAVTARGFLTPRKLLVMAVPLLLPGGRVVFMGGPSLPAGPDLVASSERRMRCSSDRTFRLPGGEETRRIVVLEGDNDVCSEQPKCFT